MWHLVVLDVAMHCRQPHHAGKKENRRFERVLHVPAGDLRLNG
jgi:hypothetical protein